MVSVPKVAPPRPRSNPCTPRSLCPLPLGLLPSLSPDPPRHIWIPIHRLLVRRIIFRLSTTVTPYLPYPLSTTMLTSPVTIHPAPKSPPHAESLLEVQYSCPPSQIKSILRNANFTDKIHAQYRDPSTSCYPHAQVSAIQTLYQDIDYISHHPTALQLSITGLRSLLPHHVQPRSVQQMCDDVQETTWR